MRFRITVFVGLLLPGLVAAAVIEVPSQVPTIQAGVDLAAAGDTVLVAAGQYAEVVHVDATVLIRSAAGPGATRLDGGFVLNGGPSAPPSGLPMGIEGFTIVGAQNLVGIEASAVALDLRDCIVAGCTWHGAQLYSAEYHIVRCVFAGNGSNGILLSQSTLDMSDSTITGNGGTGLKSVVAYIDLLRCLLAFNGGYGCVGSLFYAFGCCNIYGNDSGDWYTDIADFESIEGNMSYDPLFCADDPVAEMNFTLEAGSPCAVWPALCDTIGFGAANCRLSDVPHETDAPPRPARLVGAAPNPFNPSTTIGLHLDRPGHARVTVHDATGRRVATPADRSFSAGAHEVRWRGVDDRGRALSSGVYFVRLEAGVVRDLLKLVIIR